MLGLHKTGWRIKKLISHRKTPNLDTSGSNSFEDVRFVDTKVSTTSTKRLSWLSQSPTVEIAPLRWATSHATVRTYHTPTANTTARSSATSLCSCDCAENPASREPPLSKEWPASNQPEILYLPPLSPSHASGDAQTWRLIFSDSPSRSAASSIPNSAQKGRPPVTIAAGSTFDLIEALALESNNGNKTPTQTYKHKCELEMEDLSENVEQLIRETDAAFQAVGTALADAKAATQGWYDTNAPLPHNPSLSRSILKRDPRSSIPPLKTQASRSQSVVKKRKSAKTNLLDRALRSNPLTSASTFSRWTLTNVTTSVAEVFSGKIFRTEVDEMLTPGRLQQLQNCSKLENERRESADSARSAETDDSTPTEPFHLESLSNRISAVQQNLLPSARPVLPPTVTPQQANKAKRLPLRKVQFADPAMANANAGMKIHELTFPSPAQLPRRPSASGDVPYLPTIPETSPLSLSPADLCCSTPTTLSSSPIHPEPEGNYIYLPCSPYTLISPLFRHGAIRVPLPFREPKFSPRDEESLDWTAFQMAISGTGCVEECSVADIKEREEREGMELEEEQRERDGILEWWAGFGFQGLGKLVGEPRLKKSPNLSPRHRRSVERMLRREAIERSPSVLEEVKAPPRYSGTWKREMISDTPNIIASCQRETGAAIDVQLRETLTESLPPSPMLDLVVPSESKDNEIIPMGFNLGHDLGDFLNWEMHHVQAFFADD